MPILIGVCLLWSAMAKTVDLGPTIALLTSRGIEFRAAQTSAWTLVFVEIALGCWLLSGIRAILAGIAAGIFLVVGSASILYQLWTKSQLSCGCGLPTFGLSPESGQLLGLIRNAILIVMVVLGSVPGEAASASDGPLERSAS
ncbi:MAG: hypothetical protein J0L78_15180 [Planctomycetes bacterium]|nr:hypothetical protein [Planctomycetota bacterium]